MMFGLRRMKMTNSVITDCEWSAWFYYDPTSPSFLSWKVDIINKYGRKTKTRKGMQAGSIDVHGYYRVQLNRKCYKNHRIIFEMMHNVRIDPSHEVDHVDGVRHNNEINNLKSTTMNSRNCIKGINNTSGFKGVNRSVSTQVNGLESPYWRATWCSIDGKPKSKSFCINKYGEIGAFELAVKERENALILLNMIGAGYSERHLND